MTIQEIIEALDKAEKVLQPHLNLAVKRSDVRTVLDHIAALESELAATKSQRNDFRNRLNKLDQLEERDFDDA